MQKHSTDLLCLSVDWLLYDRDLRHERADGKPHFLCSDTLNCLKSPKKTVRFCKYSHQMLKVNNKNTMSLWFCLCFFWCLCCWFLTYFTPFSSAVFLLLTLFTSTDQKFTRSLLTFGSCRIKCTINGYSIECVNTFFCNARKRAFIKWSLSTNFVFWLLTVQTNW